MTYRQCPWCGTWFTDHRWSFCTRDCAKRYAKKYAEMYEPKKIKGVKNGKDIMQPV